MVIAEFVALDPTAMADTLYAELEAEGMLYAGDDEAYQELRAWYEERVETALTDLDQFREPRP